MMQRQNRQNNKANVDFNGILLTSAVTSTKNNSLEYLCVRFDSFRESEKKCQSALVKVIMCEALDRRLMTFKTALMKHFFSPPCNRP